MLVIRIVMMCIHVYFNIYRQFLRSLGGHKGLTSHETQPEIFVSYKMKVSRMNDRKS